MASSRLLIYGLTLRVGAISVALEGGSGDAPLQVEEPRVPNKPKYQKDKSNHDRNHNKHKCQPLAAGIHIA
jgi:hypothetical protein